MNGGPAGENRQPCRNMPVAFEILHGQKFQSTAKQVYREEHGGDGRKCEYGCRGDRQFPIVLYRRKQKKRNKGFTGAKYKYDE